MEIAAHSPTHTQWLRSQRDNLAQPHCRDPQARAIEKGTGAGIASGGGNQRGLGPPGRGVCKRPKCHLAKSSTTVVTVPTLAVHYPVLQLLVTPTYHAGVRQRGLLVTPSEKLWGALFLVKLLVEIQTVTELCSFGKGTILPHLECTARAPPSPPLNHLACPSGPCGLTLLSSALQGNLSATQS